MSATETVQPGGGPEEHRPPAAAAAGPRGHAPQTIGGRLRRIPSAVGRRLGRVPRAGRICFVIALVNAVVWGIVVPPFEVPDEIAHFGYAQYLAQTGKAPPQTTQPPYSEQEQQTLVYLFFYQTIGRAGQRAIMTSVENSALQRMLATDPSPLGPGGADSSTNQPPLYYALEAIPYWIVPTHEILTKLAVMRLLSALMAACTVLAVFLFLRELMPRTPWAWTVGALLVAFQPTFDFIAAGVHGDNLLFLAASLTFLMLLRTYRRGLTMHRGALLGAIIGAGVLSKLTFIALLPGIALAMALLAWRALPAGRRRALGALAVTTATAALPVAVYVLLNVTVWHRGSPTAGGIAGATNSTLPAGGTVTLHETLDYVWQLYLPRLPFMHHTYFTTYPLWTTWLNGLIGHFGWLDYSFPVWVYEDGRRLVYVLAALALIGLVRVRAGIRPLLGLCACFAVMAIGLLGAIGYTGIRYRLSTGFAFEQARYVLPLAVFYALFLVLAARALPRRWAPVLGGLLVVLAMAHGLFAETLTISRYYG